VLIGLILIVTLNRVVLTYNGFSINRLYNGFDGLHPLVSTNFILTFRL